MYQLHREPAVRACQFPKPKKPGFCSSTDTFKQQHSVSADSKRRILPAFESPGNTADLESSKQRPVVELVTSTLRFGRSAAEDQPIYATKIAGAWSCDIGIYNIVATTVVDTGPRISFINETFVIKHNLPMSQQKSPQILVVSGWSSTLSRICRAFEELLGLKWDG